MLALCLAVAGLSVRPPYDSKSPSQCVYRIRLVGACSWREVRQTFGPAGAGAQLLRTVVRPLVLRVRIRQPAARCNRARTPGRVLSNPTAPQQ